MLPSFPRREAPSPALFRPPYSAQPTEGGGQPGATLGSPPAPAGGGAGGCGLGRPAPASLLPLPETRGGVPGPAAGADAGAGPGRGDLSARGLGRLCAPIPTPGRRVQSSCSGGDGGGGSSGGSSSSQGGPAPLAAPPGAVHGDAVRHSPLSHHPARDPWGLGWTRAPAGPAEAGLGLGPPPRRARAVRGPWASSPARIAAARPSRPRKWPC